MEGKFTKGEWTITKSENSFWAYIESPSKTIGAFAQFDEQGKANALLASKAPELLSNLNSAIKLLHSLEWPSNMQETLFNFCANAEQLITDATTI